MPVPEDTADKLRFELLQVQTEGLKLQLEAMRQRLDARIDSAASDIADHETRLREVEQTSTKFNFLLYLTMGGGLVGLFNLLAIVVLIINTMGGKTP